MKIAIYPGSFNPWHEGHQDIVNKALKIFDKVVIAIGRNPSKPPTDLKELKNLWGEVVDSIGVEDSHRIYRDWETDRKSTRLNSSHSGESRMPSSA